MGRRLRFIPAGSLVEVTCRTIQGRFLLSPSPALRELTLGILGRAQAKYGVEIHLFVFLSNHYHMLLTVQDAQQLSRFMGFVNSNLAREAGRLHAWREKFWGRRFQAIPVSEEEAAQVDRFRYVLSHGAKEGLVGSPTEWPGAHCLGALLEDRPLEGQWVDRTAEYEARRRGKTFDPAQFSRREIVRLTPLPCWKPLREDTRRDLIAGLVRAIEEEMAAVQGLAQREPLGAEESQRVLPHAEPVRSKRSPAPLVHAASKAVRQAFRTAYREFVAAFRLAAERLLRGDPNLDFPEGSFPPHPPFVSPLVSA